MGRQTRLVLQLLLVVAAVVHLARASTPHSLLDIVHDNEIKDNQLDTSEEQHASSSSGSGIKISTPKVKDAHAPLESSSSASTSAKKSTPTSSTTQKTVSDDILKDLIEASKHSAALAVDPRFNKMLPDKYKMENATAAAATNKSDESYDEYDDNYDYDDDDYNYDETTSVEQLKKSKSTTTAKPAVSSSTSASPTLKAKKTVEMKPIKEVAKLTSKSKELLDDKHTNEIDEHNKKMDDEDDYDDEDDDDDDDDDDDEDDIADEEEIVFNENVPCPRYCVCARNVNRYLVATCSRFDPGTQKFGSDITDLIVTDVGPKYPILLGPEFFLQMGLKHVSSIKIANCTIEYLHPTAFHGLDSLYAVNLTNVGLAIINPNTFAKNKMLRILTISGNDLSVMSNVNYLLKSTTIEELDLSNNNLMDLNPNAFSQLPNIVYINLSQNNLQKIPEKVFDTVETIEELDLSYNSLKSLPPNVFNRTALAILHLKYNSITGDLRFGTNDLQQLDLSFNSIKQIHHGMFDKMTGLTNLNLKGNGFTKIQPDSFAPLKFLRHIDLSINELDQISSMVFYKNSDLDVIRMNDNPRLSQLPTDGFLTYNGYFTVYYLDISNCAIGALGHKSFSTMPHLATLKLAWNNINNLEHDTFLNLTKLIDLDLSNNLIAKLDDLTFMNNNELTKLNLAGNPIRRLSVRLFLPMNKLRELDVSDCELTSLLAENKNGMGLKYNFYETLRSFNASANQIKRISSSDVKAFKNLRTLDISNNPLKCNEDFQDFISYVSLSNNLYPKKMPTLANLESATTFIEFHPDAAWAQLAHQVCKHRENMLHTLNLDEDKLEKSIAKADKDLDEDAKKLLNLMESSKLAKILKDSRKSEEAIAGHSLDEKNVNEDELNNANEEKDVDEDNASDYDDGDDDEDDDDEDDDTEITEDDINFHKEFVDKLRNHGVQVEEIDLDKDTKDDFLLNKFTIHDDDDSNSDTVEEEKIFIERGHIYYSGYRFLIPVIVIATCLVVLLLAIVKFVTLVMRKRGERYRMALLASSKNSIVYQKLTEDIKPTAKELKQPKVHRYAPINQV